MIDNLADGWVDGSPYRVTNEHGWVVRASDGTNAYEPGWRWNSRASARAFKDECEWLGHVPSSTAMVETPAAKMGR
jgi:RES domain-containing protein